MLCLTKKGDLMKDITGLSLILGKGIKHFGKYKRGIWFDNNEILKLPKEQRTGFGLKIDICFGRTIRPVGILWNKECWNNEKMKIYDLDESQWDEFFGVLLAGRIRRLKQFDPTRLKHGAYNPWYAKKWFTLRLPKWIPSMFISVGLGKKWSFYIGNKAYQIDPFTRDITWANAKDRKRAMREKPATSYFALCPSATSRPTRMT